MNSVCPIGKIGMTHPVICSVKHLFEGRFMEKWMEKNCSSPVNREHIRLVKPCDLNENFLGLFENVENEKDYRRTFFTQNLEILLNYRNEMHYPIKSYVKKSKL